MSYRNARLANGFLSLDKLAKELDLVKSRRVSDSGAGVERMVGDIDRRPGDIERAHLCASMFEQGEIKNPITSLQSWLNETYPETAAYLAYRARRTGGAK